MDQLIDQVSQRAGITPDQARQAIAAVSDFVKTKVPAPVAAQLDSLLGGQSGQSSGGMMDQARGAMGEMFGNAPDTGS
ncbi:MAG TPA: hypothetical protein VGP82_02530 [Ktedonobacterales bacterium]|jgi:hypothetical protein|nr:hypothetical protein [Ktedonobacterales bacterium]